MLVKSLSPVCRDSSSQMNWIWFRLQKIWFFLYTLNLSNLLLCILSQIFIDQFSDISSKLWQCPYGTHKIIRAQWKCSDKNRYHCLLDKNKQKLIEVCKHPKNYRKGMHYCKIYQHKQTVFVQKTFYLRKEMLKQINFELCYSDFFQLWKISSLIPKLGIECMSISLSMLTADSAL